MACCRSRPTSSGIGTSSACWRRPSRTPASAHSGVGHTYAPRPESFPVASTLISPAGVRTTRMSSRLGRICLQATHIRAGTFLTLGIGLRRLLCMLIRTGSIGGGGKRLVSLTVRRLDCLHRGPGWCRDFRRRLRWLRQYQRLCRSFALRLSSVRLLRGHRGGLPRGVGTGRSCRRRLCLSRDRRFFLGQVDKQFLGFDFLYLRLALDVNPPSGEFRRQPGILPLAADRQRQLMVRDDDHQLSLAIGREGQNARLAAKLTGWRIDIKSETQIKEIEAKKLFVDLPEEEAAVPAEAQPAAAGPAGADASGETATVPAEQPDGAEAQGEGPAQTLVLPEPSEAPPEIPAPSGAAVKAVEAADGEGNEPFATSADAPGPDELSKKTAEADA